MLYREATRDDAEAIAALHAESWRLHYRGAYRDEFLDGDVLEDRRKVWTARLAAAPPEQFVVVAQAEGSLAGFACTFGGEDDHWGSLLDNLHVRSELHRQGVGARLVRETAAWCREHYPDCGLYLWVLTGNLRAQRFYQRMGASDRGGAVFEPPGGGRIDSRRYAWTTLREPGLAARS